MDAAIPPHGKADRVREDRPEGVPAVPPESPAARTDGRRYGPAGEVDPSSLESKMRPGLFLAGEILDVQGRRGGFNLGWAWASGWLAGRAGTP